MNKWLTPKGLIHFTTTGSSMNIEIKITGEPVILWTYHDGSTSNLANPGIINFGSSTTRYHTLYVSDNWSDVTEFNAHSTSGFIIDLFEMKSLSMTGSLYCSSTSITGDVANFPSGLTGTLSCSSTSVAGDVANFPSGLTGSLYCYNTSVAGDIANLPSGLTGSLSCSGASITGDVANFPSGLTGTLYCSDTSVTGDIANLPSGLTESLNCSNTSITGDVANFPSGLTGYLYCSGTSVAGDIANLPSGLTGYLYCYNTSITSYTSVTWPLQTGNSKKLNFNNLGLSQADVDDILCDLDTFGNTGCTLQLIGNSAPSATGDTCVANLVGKGWTISHD